MKPLEGVRVLAVELFAAGPYGTMFLAELGASVIKIETAGGDPARFTGPHLLGPAESEYFHTWNAGKESLVLDLKSAEGRQAFHRLVTQADAVVNNLRGDQATKLGLDHASLRAVNPAVVCLHISAYGRDNGRRSWPGYDYLMQAESGLMSMTGEPDGPPSRCGASIVDYMTGLTGMVGLLACLMRARQTGEGCDVDTCLFDVGLHQLGYAATWYLNHGDVSGRVTRSSHLSVAPVQTLPTRDGWVFVMCMTDKFWTSLVTALRRPDLLADARFATAAVRADNRDDLAVILDDVFRQDTTAAWVERLSGVLPVAPVNDLAQALENPFVEETEMVRRLPHPANPEFRLLANPLRIDGVRPSAPICTPLGAGSPNFAARAPQPIVAEGALP